MSRYEAFTRTVHSQHTLISAYARTSSEGGGRVLLEDGVFVLSAAGLSAADPSVELVLGDGAWLEVRDGLTPNVQLTLPEDYVEELDRAPGAPDRLRRLYWSSPISPRGLGYPTQNPFDYGDVILHVPESLEPVYRETGFPEYGSRAAATWRSGRGTSRGPLRRPPQSPDGRTPERPSSRRTTTPGSASHWQLSA